MGQNSALDMVASDSTLDTRTVDNHGAAAAAASVAAASVAAVAAAAAAIAVHINMRLQMLNQELASDCSHLAPSSKN